MDTTIYSIKRVKWKDSIVGIVCQNVNGPCPLLGLCNVLILRQELILPPKAEVINFETLASRLSDVILQRASTQKKPTDTFNDNEVDKNFEMILNDAFSVLSGLQHGLDINIRFSSVRDFEFTSQLSIFDILRINLFHGWVVGKDHKLHEVISKLTYNSLVEKIINSKDASVSKEQAKIGLLLEDFMNESQSQLTTAGLKNLDETMIEGEMCVFFRNNHFSTLVKESDKLYMLVTDQGYLNEPVVWESLEGIDGNGYLLDGNFKRYVAKPRTKVSDHDVAKATSTETHPDFLLSEQLQDEENKRSTLPSANTSCDQNSDFLLAQKLHQEELQRIQTESPPPNVPVNIPATKTLTPKEQEEADMELARKLHREEEEREQQEEEKEKEKRKTEAKRKQQKEREQAKNCEENEECTLV